MIQARALVGKHNSDLSHPLAPYLGTRAVNADQISQALASGLTVEEIHDRLLDAEIELATAYDPDAYQRGWLTACDAIVWLGTPDNEDDINFADLKELADDRYQSARRSCYAAALTNGSPALNVDTYSDTLGRVDCCECGLWFVCDSSNNWTELAGIMRSTSDRRELRAMAGREQARIAVQAMRPIWTPYGNLTADQLEKI